jgi:hypothetical protein
MIGRSNKIDGSGKVCKSEEEEAAVREVVVYTPNQGAKADLPSPRTLKGHHFLASRLGTSELDLVSGLEPRGSE